MVNQDNYTEAKIQKEAVFAVRNTYPETDGCFYHVPNGGDRDNITAAILTGQGVVPGIQDLHFIWKGRLYLIEVKDKSGSVSLSQRIIHAQHKRQGFNTYIFRTSEQIFYFVKYIIEGRNISCFDRFISKYAVSENLEQYKEDFRLYRIANAEKKSKKKIDQINNISY